MSILKKFIASAATLAALLGATAANAHTIAIGSTNAGAPGSVTLWMGTYSHGTPIFQGSIQLVAGPSNVGAIQAFSSVTNTRPAGLVEGDNYFYADAHGGSAWGNLPSDSFTSVTNLVGLGPVTDWQGATFTGLTAGTYTYQLSGMTSQNWTNINSFETNWRGTLEITSTSTGVPLPGTLALLGLGLVGFGLRRRAA